MARQRGYMPVKLATKVIDQLREMKFKGSLITSLMGEPLLYPHFKEILNYSIESGIRTNVITNFLLIPERVSYKELLTTGIDTLVLSYQTPNETTFMSRRANISFNRYFSKLKNILLYARDNCIHTRRIEIHILQSFYNYLNIEVVSDYSLIESAVLQLWNILNPDKSGLTEKALDYKAVVAEIKKYRRGKQYLDTFEILISPRIYVVLKRANTWANYLIPQGCIVSSKRKGHCGFFRSSLGVLWDGRCTVCCQDFDGQIHVGDAKLNTIEQILEGDSLAGLREMEKKGLLNNEFCQTCKGIIKKSGRKFSMIKDEGILNKIFQLSNRIKVKLNL